MIRRIRSVRSCTHFWRENGRKASDSEKGESDFYFIVVGSLSMMTRSTWINKAIPLWWAKQDSLACTHTHSTAQSTRFGHTRMNHGSSVDYTSAPEVICAMKQKGLPRLAGRTEMPDNNPFIWQLIFAIDGTHIQNSDQSSIGLRDSHDRKDMRIANCEMFMFRYTSTHPLALWRWSNLPEWPGAWPKRITGCVDGDTKWRRLRMETMALMKRNKNTFGSGCASGCAAHFN